MSDGLKLVIPSILLVFVTFIYMSIVRGYREQTEQLEKEYTELEDRFLTVKKYNADLALLHWQSMPIEDPDQRTDEIRSRIGFNNPDHPLIWIYQTPGLVDFDRKYGPPNPFIGTRELIDGSCEVVVFKYITITTTNDFSKR